ncbi:hypothetical protein COHA_000048 [Chlorella ohadii]|uniref:Methyltransferase FkbM domain-containing protein n=1 Tax=Chlorella ohadii TaxID=2649997 RepID=A0AAD5E139_9CHLO|nr:hypothetical protein COHA_000048 [Chlorella ohadii]
MLAACLPARLQVTAVLQDSSKLAGQLFWAEVGSVPCRKDGCCKQLFSFRYGTTDVLVFQQIFRDHYLRALYSLFPEDAAPKYILDAGANAGYATALFKLLWPDATVVSLEPDPSNFAQLRRNTAGFSGVHRLNAGLWGRQANITLSSNCGRGEEWGKDVAQMFNIPRFDFVKIDIEGAEGRVFVPGADLSWLGGPRVVSLEIHDFFAERFGMTAVSGHVDAAFAQHPNYQIARDNEHVFFIDNEQLAAANLAAKPGGGTP